ncbi:MMPL family transporter [Lysinibacillus piscis]|uniref:Membrane protein n=1 Tax=Lysinibacillus piscis TaxID=2518931 RepID=A0ABQ5NLU4_9BACI|nr:MMPL family transporter [Lysinibacillus sp. KH24]GLC89061.1 membrane protein [Lysinibacillus sp. KH24]
MKKIMNWRLASFVLWIVVTVMIVMTMPNLEQLVREKGQITIPDSAQSNQAEAMLKQMNENNGDSYQIIAIFNSGHEQALTTSQKTEIEKIIKQLKSQQSAIGIRQMMTHLDNEQTQQQLISQDKSTILAQISVQKNNREIADVAKELYKIVASENVDVYLTGDSLVMEDFVQSTQEGIQKTEVISVIFIIVVLILIFRSPIVPFVSLLSVGISYLVSLGIIAHLVDQFNYPFSNFTQVFLVVILFGIGTDYNILLFTRFKEELVKQEDSWAAVRATYKTAGKTVLYSALAVFIGFIALILAEFKLYQASSSVSIGVAVLVLVLMTLNPFFMMLLGKKLFWPAKTFHGHNESKIWGLLARTSVIRPFIALIFIAILCVPFVMSYSHSLSYNDLLEVDDRYSSKQGINVIEQHFPAGFSSPTTLVIQSNHALDNAQSLQALDELAEQITQIDGVAEVLTATRPIGEKITDFYMTAQTKQLNNGLGDANDGVGKINNGLSTAEQQFKQADTNDIENVQALIDGTTDVKAGVASLSDAVEQLASGVGTGANGAQELEEGLASVKENMATLSHSVAQLMNSYTAIEKGLASFSSSFSTIQHTVDSVQKSYEQIENSMTALIQSKPELANDVHVQTTMDIASTNKQQLGDLSAQLQVLTAQYGEALASFKEANTALAQVNHGFSQLQVGVSQLYDGSSSLKQGLQKAANGSNEMASQTPALAAGLTVINDGQKQLLTGLTDLANNMITLQTGLAESTNGLQEVSRGLTNAQHYLTGLSESKASEKFYIPQDALKSTAFQSSLNMYMSDDRKTAKMGIILDVNPYSKEAMVIVKRIEQAIMKHNALQGMEAAIGGKTAQNVDLEEIANGDFTRTAMMMLIGIGIILIIITRSFLTPIFIIGALVLTYFTALGMSELFSMKLLHVNELGWNVPFFGFIMIVALGVDYSIFLLMRYREMDHHSTQAIVDATRHIGGVVIAAAIILGGTFAALIPSGILTLMEIALTVIFGLFLLSFVTLPILIPALFGIVERIRAMGRMKKEG